MAKRRMLFVLVVLLLSVQSFASHHRVPEDYTTIQEAIDSSIDGDIVILAIGTYGGDGNRSINCQGKAITVRSIDPNDASTAMSTIIDCEHAGYGFLFENGEHYETQLDGLTICNAIGGGIRIFNSSPSIVNCTIRDNKGGGVHCENGSPVITGSTVEKNMGSRTYRDGGGICCYNSTPSITNCTIRENSTYGHANGGGIYIYGGTYDPEGIPMIGNCLIKGNSSGSGGGLCINWSSALISHCVITENHAVGAGGIRLVGVGQPNDILICMEHCQISNNSANSLSGGVYIIGCGLDMTNCIVSGNSSLYGGAGGGITLGMHSQAFINLCTIVGNKVAHAPDANCLGGGLYLMMCDAIITNSIINQNRASQGRQLAINAWDGIQRPNEPPSLHPTLVEMHHNNFRAEQDQELYLYGEPNLLHFAMYDNLHVDPCYAVAGYWDPNGTELDPNDDYWVEGDYHLQSQAGRWDPTLEEWVLDTLSSPCIDAGDPNTAIRYEPIPNGGLVNIGAYGGTIQASKSLFDAEAHMQKAIEAYNSE